MAAEVVLTVDASTAQLERLRAQLKSNQLRQALYRVVFNTTRAMAVVLKTEVKELTGLQPKYVNKAITYEVGTYGLDFAETPEGRVIISREPIPLQAYPTSVTKRAGVVARLPGGPQRFQHGFRAKIFGGRRILQEDKSRPKIVRDGRKAYPVKQFSGPPIISNYRDPATQARITERARVMLAKNVQSQLDRFLTPR
jgi:hypothetical protein